MTTFFRTFCALSEAKGMDITMKKKKWMKRLGCVMLTAMLGVSNGALSSTEVLAGSSDIVVDNRSFAKALEETKWNSANGDITVEGGKIIFSKESTLDTRLITRKPATATDFFEEVFHANYTVRLTALPEGQKFVAGFSLKTIESYSGEAGNIEVVFENSGGIKASVRAYGEDGSEQMLAAATNCGISLNMPFRMSVQATNDNKIIVTVNNKTLFNDVSPVDVDGRIGFLQSGSCAAEIHALEIVSHTYNTPENTNIVEDFENTSIDANTMTCTSNRPTTHMPYGIRIEEYNGSRVLMFRNMIDGSFGTKHQYSNFEISFDVPYCLFNTVVDEAGDVIAQESAGFVIGIGDDTDTHSAYGYHNSVDGIICEPRSISNLQKDARVELKDKGYYDEEKNQGYSVKVKVYDTQVTAYVKAMESKTWDEVLTYSLGDATPTGYVHVWATGRANFGIDNFQIVNLDEGAKLLELEPDYRTVPEGEDWEYKETEAVYREAEESQIKFDWAMLPVYAAVAAVVIVGGCAVVAKVKHISKKKEVTNP